MQQQDEQQRLPELIPDLEEDLGHTQYRSEDLLRESSQPYSGSLRDV